MMNDSGFISHETSLGSPGHDGLKWLKPVRPGDRLFGTAEITDVRVSRSKPSLGFVTHIAKLTNDRKGRSICLEKHVHRQNAQRLP
jgi:acyl dehydratase